MLTRFRRRAENATSIQPQAELGPYSDRIASDLGEAALYLSTHLQQKPVWRGSTERRWLRQDKEAFMELTEYLMYDREAQTVLMLPGRALGSSNHVGYELESRLSEVHEALPFSEGERRWLVDLFEYEGDGRWGKPESSIRKASQDEQFVFSAGRRQPVAGQDLLDRWYAYRRDIFEFEGQGSREVACKALLGIGEILVPNAVELAGVPPGN